ncbi:hypothetical protein [Parachitinimonas caeni]|uniref:DUF423 domain-containing protein n=1 Tax=Parachitinimonas caeni TaxID=3031301 RepID=A0ABT7E0I5_9NEIS|nr:hypothetical protein [Parachitinimonas caeni]MDK2125574.1 hypothetical protein [Parachitinimonas caeni]
MKPPLNRSLLGAAGLAGLTALVHTFAGQADVVSPFLASSLDATLKYTLLACWHMVTVALWLSTLGLLWASRAQAGAARPLVLLLATAWLGFALVFGLVNVWFAGQIPAWALPQWILLLPVGALGLYAGHRLEAQT